ncbi:2-hydroxychromene-2-carboxylate isomerase [Acuticoccus sp.]|uniref:2-hydroxychromene-2-carboxylate isomerase n=1 Tax=Acuticoccus sp. TaxID=1904378 RepID=UPI003B524A5E
MALTFYYDFTSSYSYLAVMRMEDAAAEAGVEVVWRPFLLGPIFADAGLGATPNLRSPAKADFMWHDIARRAMHRGMPFTKPAVFPQRSVAAGRAALALGDAERPAFSRAVYRCVFVEGRDQAEPDVLADAAREAGLDPDRIAAGAQDPAAKAALFAAVDEAKEHGLFGAPSFVTTGGERFWGDAQLEDALSWEASGRLAGT